MSIARYRPTAYRLLLTTLVALLLWSPAAAFAQSVTWVVEPPRNARSGEQVYVAWRLSNFRSSVTENAVVYGVTEVEGETKQQPGGNGTYAAILTLPTVTESRRIGVVAYAQNWRVFEKSPKIPVQMEPAFTSGPPEVISATPEPNEDDVSPDTMIAVRLREDSGIDPRTISMVVVANSRLVSGSTDIQEVTRGDPREYDVEFTPAYPFALGTVVQVGVDASSVYGIGMDTFNYAFRVTKSQPALPPPDDGFADGFEYSTGDAERSLRANGWKYVILKPNKGEPGGATLRISTATKHGGRTSLHCWVPNSTSETIYSEGRTNKAMVAYKGMAYGWRDTVITTMWLYIPSGSTGKVKVVDIESSNARGNPGVRFELEDNQVIFNRDKIGIWPGIIGAYARIPKNRWFQFRTELTIGKGTAGRIKAIVDGTTVLDARTTTIIDSIPFYDTVQVGITGRWDRTYELLMDDVSISKIDR